MGMHQWGLAFNKILLLLKLLDFLLFKSSERFTLYAPHQAHTSIKKENKKQSPNSNNRTEHR
jgi:hypothetical protein